MVTTKPCPVRGCTRVAPGRQMLCARDFLRLPGVLQLEVRRARKSDPVAHADVRTRALAWLAEHPREVQPR